MIKLLSYISQYRHRGGSKAHTSSKMLEPKGKRLTVCYYAHIPWYWGSKVSYRKNRAEQKYEFKLRMVTLNVDLKWVWWPASVHKNLQEIENDQNDFCLSLLTSVYRAFFYYDSNVFHSFDKYTTATHPSIDFLNHLSNSGSWVGVWGVDPNPADCQSIAELTIRADHCAAPHITNWSWLQVLRGSSLIFSFYRFGWLYMKWKPAWKVLHW